VIATIPLSASPTASALSPDGSRLYVTAFNSSRVAVIDTDSNTEIASIAVGTNPRDIAVTPDGTHALVTNFVSGTVSVISLATNTVTTTIAGVSNGWSLAVTPDGSTALVTTNGFDRVWIIDLSTNTVVSSIPISGASLDISLNPTGTEAYVALRDSSEVAVIDVASLAVVATIAVGPQPRGITFSEDGARAFVGGLGTSSISVVDTSTRAQVGTIALDAPYASVFTVDDSLYSVSYTTDTLARIDVDSLSVISTVTVGDGPVELTVSDDGTTVYVSNSIGNSISVVSIDQLAELADPSTVPAASVGDSFSFDSGSGGSPAPVYSVSDGALPDGLALDTATGVISGEPTAGGSTTFKISATNAAGTVTEEYTIDVSDLAVLAAPSTVPIAILDEAFTFDSGSGGTPAPVYSVSTGALPAGLLLDSATGIISGEATALGDVTFEISATNAAGTESETYTITVAQRATLAAPASVPDATIGTAYTFDFGTGGSPAPVFAVSSGSLPEGLSLDAGTGVVSGTPTAARASTFSITATNVAGVTSETYVITTAAVPGALAITGADVALPLTGALALLLLGGGLLLVRRRRVRTSH
jgi:YVTN family beta-propeller protein